MKFMSDWQSLIDSSDINLRMSPIQNGGFYLMY